MKRWIISSLLALGILIGLGVFFIDVILEGIVKSRLESAIQLQKNRIYDYQFESVKTQFLKGSLSLEGLKLTPRKDISVDRGDMKDVYEIALDEFRLEGLDSWRLILDNEISIGWIYMSKPDIKVYSKAGKRKKKAHHSFFSEVIAPTLKLARIDSIKYELARFEMIRVGLDTVTLFSFDSLNLSIYDLLIDSSLISQGLYFDYEGLSMDARNIALNILPNVDIELNGLVFNPNEQILEFKDLYIKPKKDKYAFMQDQDHETDWVSIKLKDLSLKEVDFDKLHLDGILDIREITVDEPEIELYRDKRMPDPPYSFKPLPFRALRKLDFPFHVSQINVNKAQFTYVEWGENADEPGVLKMDQLNASINNLSSDSAYLSRNDTLYMTMDARFMKSGVMKMKLKAPILDTSDLFFMSGELSSLDCQAMNPLLEHQAFVKFETGTINYVRFDMKGDNLRSEGILDIDYRGLKKITFLRNKEEMEDKVKKSGKSKEGKRMMSFLANTFLLNDYHPGMVDYYQGRIRFERDLGKAIFNYIFHSIMTGIRSSVLPNLGEDWKEIRKQHQKEIKRQRAKQKELQNSDAEKTKGKKKSKKKEK